MDRLVSGEQDFEVDIEAGLAHVTQESTSDNASETIDDDVNYPLMGDEENPTETNSQSLDVSERKRDVVKFKKPRKASKPPRPPKRPSLTASDHKVMREIAELAMRKRERIERMKKSLRRIKAAKSSSSSSSFSYISIFSMIVTVLFLGILVSQGFFAGNSNLSSDISPAPIVSPDNQLVSAQLYNDPSPTTSYSFRYTRKRISGAEEGEDSRDVTR
ncbi:unnamed protein product [Brassica oleracea var. botrytis]|uniref:BnaC08g49660D protein n=4 Tax=Brassica TaxID=3705 RepID=A0A078IY86_BRANA|nr:PREDICTED: uncharacterized protein LOC106310557 isoform X1 [Brassica oleracea var. oleracea]XP_013670381.1 uncharacterized protein BNAC08G49660D isoform X1 [Brassica napus]KAG2260562.1 hypothetical protein Bca52824_079856 [Brassica carinata]KAH0866698.1 hypothetical protein HID58_083909 [Brassica napus]CAF2116958.1 unnamed protein product [Brassica napus]CDY55312.1 BnaC08g49660D [Brassica napus]